MGPGGDRGMEASGDADPGRRSAAADRRAADDRRVWPWRVSGTDRRVHGVSLAWDRLRQGVRRTQGHGPTGRFRRSDLERASGDRGRTLRPERRPHDRQLLQTGSRVSRLGWLQGIHARADRRVFGGAGARPGNRHGRAGDGADRRHAGVRRRATLHLRGRTGRRACDRPGDDASPHASRCAARMARCSRGTAAVATGQSRPAALDA